MQPETLKWGEGGLKRLDNRELSVKVVAPMKKLSNKFDRFVLVQVSASQPNQEFHFSTC